jgi:two-component system, sensor histidine kinase LadS
MTHAIASPVAGHPFRPCALPRTLLLAWFLLMLWCWSAAAFSAQDDPPTGTLPTVILDGRLSSVSLNGQSVFWIDESGQLDVDTVEAQAPELPFQWRQEGHRVRLGEHGALWVRFSAEGRDIAKDWELELSRSATDSVELFYRNAHGTWVVQRAGDAVPVSQWPSPDRLPVFELDSHGEGPTTYWVRILHSRVPFSGELVIHSARQLRQDRIQQQFLLGGYFGLALLLIGVAAVNGIVFRDTAFRAYAGYVGLLALAQAASLGTGGQFLWPDSVAINSRAEFVLLPLAGIAGLMFLRHIAQPRFVGPLVTQGSVTVSAIWLGLTVWDQLASSTLSFQAITLGGTVVMGWVYALLWAAWRTREPWARWVVAGMLPVVLAGTLPVFRNFGLLGSGFLSQYGMVAAAALEAPILFFGLLQRSSIQHEAQARARALKVTEPLTGLTNRHNGMLRLHESLVRAQRYKHRLALLLIDLHNHGHFEKELGREVGDRALVLTAALLRSVARDVDTAARVDNHTFVLLMEGPVSATQAVAAATTLVAAGLRPSTQLPVGSTLRFKVVVAMLPDEGMGLQEDAQAHLNWLRIELDDLAKEPQKSIKTLNI